MSPPPIMSDLSQSSVLQAAVRQLASGKSRQQLASEAMTTAELFGVLPAKIRVLLAQPPPPGSGLHQHIFRCVRKLLSYTENKNLLASLLEEQLAPHCGRDITREIQQALICCVPDEDYAGDPRSRSTHKRCQSVIDQIAPVPLDELLATSPGPCNLSTFEYLDKLFEPDHLLCMAPRLWLPATQLLRDFPRRAECHFQLMVPNPMTALSGTTKEGKSSPRSLENVGPRRYLVIEFDSGTAELQAGLLRRLAQVLPVCLIVWSGQKSLHGWFSLEGVPPGLLEQIMDAALVLGADPATLSPIQFIRTPNAVRDTGVVQSVLYFDPAAIRY